jgi:hypothetical protein
MEARAPECLVHAVTRSPNNVPYLQCIVPSFTVYSNQNCISFSLLLSAAYVNLMLLCIFSNFVGNCRPGKRLHIELSWRIMQHACHAIVNDRYINLNESLQVRGEPIPQKQWTTPLLSPPFFYPPTPSTRSGIPSKSFLSCWCSLLGFIALWIRKNFYEPGFQSSTCRNQQVQPIISACLNSNCSLNWPLS